MLNTRLNSPLKNMEGHVLRPNPDQGISDVSGWRKYVVAGALLIGIGLLVWGFVTSNTLIVPTASGSLQKMLAAVAVALVVGGGAMVARQWARRIFVSAAILLLLAGFGWIAVAVAVIAFLAFAVVGETILPGEDAYDTVSVQASIGIGCYLLLFGVLVHFPINTPLVYGALLAAPLCRLSTTRLIVGRLARWLDGDRPTRADIAAATLLFAIIVLNGSGAAMPEAEFDALNQHLFVEQVVARLGFWTFNVKDYALAVMPMGVDWLFGVGNMLGNEPAAKLMSVLLFLIVMALIFTLCRRLGTDNVTAMLLTALFGSTPITITESYTLFIENGLAIFFLSGFTILFCYPGPAHRRACAAAIDTGAMLATKLLGAVLAAPLGLGALLLLRHCGGKQRLWAAALGGVGVLLGLLPYIDATALTGNPVFPYMNGVFHSPLAPMSNFPNFAKGDWLPMDIFYGATFHSEGYGSGMMDGAFGFQITALFLAAGAAAIVTRSWLMLAALSAGTFYIFVIANGVQLGLRYFYPGLPLLTVGLAALFRKEALPRVLCVGVVAALIAVNLYYNDRGYWWSLRSFKWDMLLSSARWDDTSDRYALDRLGLMPIRVLNRRVNTDGLISPRVLTLMNIGTDLDGTLLSADWMDPELDRRVSKLSSQEDFRRLVRDFGATHAIVDGADPRQAKFGSYVAATGKAIAQERFWILYRLSPELWLGPNLISQTAQPSGGDINGTSGRWNIDVLRANRLYRVQLDLTCNAPEDQFSVGVVFWSSDGHMLGNEPIGAFCGTTGQVTRLLDVVSPRDSTRASVHFSTNTPSPNGRGDLAAISFREGYPVDETWHLVP